MAKKKKKKERKIRFAYDAWWFLNNHPKFRLRERYLIKDGQADPKGHVVFEEDGVRYFEFRHSHKRALDDIGHDIFYTKVDETGYVNDDKTKRQYTEVWLEFGQIIYQSDLEKKEVKYRRKEAKKRGWDYNEADERKLDPKEYVTITHYHDWHLDVGAPTFDEALVKLANKVLKHYGDYVDDKDEHDICGGDETCIDCRRIHTMRTLPHGEGKSMCYRIVYEDELTPEELEKSQPMFLEHEKKV
jgi:hypothetical protein